MAAQDPLRQLMSMAEDLRTNIDSAISQGAKRIQATVPALPFPGEGKAPLAGPEDILAKLPKLPRLPGMAEEKATAPVAPPTPTPRPTGLGIPGGYLLRDAFHPTGYQLRT